MKLGIANPQTELGGSPEAMHTIVTSLEGMGFDHFVTYDHPMGAEHEGREPRLTGPYTMEHAFHDPFTLLMYAAALTTKLELITGVLLLPERQTVIVAKQAVDLALFSNDRFIMGVGSGWNYVEYQALGRDYRKRGRMMDEQIPLLKRLWTEKCFSHKGEVLDEHFERAGLVVMPRKPIPIWMGGWSDAQFRRAGRLGDGFLFASGGKFGDAYDAWEKIRASLREHGRSEDEFQCNLMVSDVNSSVEELADELKRWEDAGHQSGTIASGWRGFRSVEEHLDFCQKVAAKVRGG